ncbi:MAG TPA: CpsD/CapB family tyrosine-protein kinase [Candidatus Sulfotelmatobacter sp.]
MSHIYEALKKAEAQRSRGKQSPAYLATEILTTEVMSEEMSGEVLPSAEETLDTELGPVAASIDGGRQHSGMRETLPLEELDRCPALRISLPKGSRLVSISGEESLGAEKFRFLAVRLRQMRQTRPLKKILITSTIPQEGKSTVSANLACTLARRKQTRTLLLEGDLRRPTLAAQFGVGKVPGLSEWFHGDSPNFNLYRLESLGLWFLPAGSAPENPLEMMQSGKMGSLMEQLAAWFDWIVIDSPPVLPLGDTSVWARMADGILLVTRRGVTEKQQLKKGLTAIEQGKLLGALVNGSTDAAHSDYYKRYGPAAPQAGSGTSKQ